MRGLNENGMRWLAARLMIAVEDVKRFGGMSVHELRQALREIPGAENLTVSYAPGSGNMLVTIGDKTVEVRPAASNAEIALAFGNPLIATENTAVTTKSTPLPAVSFTPTGKLTVSNPAPGSFAASLKAMMDEARAGIAQARADGTAKVQDAVGKLNEAKTATVKVAGNIAQTIESEAADVMAELGQISNDLT